MCPRCFCRGKRRGFHIEDDNVKRERVYRPPLGRGALVKVVRVDEDDVMCFDERSDVSNFYEADVIQQLSINLPEFTHFVQLMN